MRRLTLYDFRLSNGPELLGIAKEDINSCAAAVNAAQERLVFAKEANEEGWAGGWAEMVFSVDKASPYITCPRGVARLESIDVCGRPVALNNQFTEYLQFGNGRMPKEDRWRRLGGRGYLTSGYTRNNTPLMNDLMDGPQQIQVESCNPLDYEPNTNTGLPKRVLVQGLDEAGMPVFTQDGPNNVEGEFVTLAPGATTQNEFSFITGIQKDVTLGAVKIFQSDPYWGSLEILSHMEPSETTAWYRRYYLNGLPPGCCGYKRLWNPGRNTDPQCGCRRREYVLVTALAKLDLVPVTTDTDYLLITSLQAVILEAQAARQSGFDSATASAKQAEYHKQAIRLLIGQITHQEGKNNPSIGWNPFGSASLNRVKINMT